MVQLRSAFVTLFSAFFDKRKLELTAKFIKPDKKDRREVFGDFFEKFPRRIRETRRLCLQRGMTIE